MNALQEDGRPVAEPATGLPSAHRTRFREYLTRQVVVSGVQRRMSDGELATWQRLQVVTERLRRRVGAGLRADADLSDAEFTVLAHLVDAGGEARPTACAAAIGWDSSRLAHQLRRLERRGLVERRSGPDGDARGSTSAITATGRTTHRAAVGAHLRAAATWFGDALDDDQLAALDDALQTLADHMRRLDGDGPGDGRPEEQEHEE
ncbi:MarR family transcriptional regulator [Curtobacterium sp. JUb34]|nr:MarR family transcriptional regulator [Curtobacterium sp. JUb34]